MVDKSIYCRMENDGEARRGYVEGVWGEAGMCGRLMRSVMFCVMQLGVCRVATP